MPFAATWLDPEIIILNEVGQTESQTHSIIGWVKCAKGGKVTCFHTHQKIHEKERKEEGNKKKRKEKGKEKKQFFTLEFRAGGFKE